MTRIAVLSRSDRIHRSMHAAAQGLADVSISLRLRAERELGSTAGIDVLIVDSEAVEDLEALVERIEPLPVVLIGGPLGLMESFADRLDGVGVLAEWETDRVIAAAQAASLGLTVREHDEWASPQEEPAQDLDLTARERDVLELLARGSTNAQIATTLGVSTNTVKFHVAGLYTKLGVNSRSEAAWQAFTRGILTL